MDTLNFDDELRRLKPVDEKCTIHNEQKVQIQGIEHVKPFCQSCTKETIQSEINHISKGASERLEKRNTYDWLSNLSILSDETIKKARFDNYTEDEDETKVNKKKARLIAKSYLGGEAFNTVMSGNPGAGKSHLAMSILQAVNEFSEPYRKCLFISVDELMRRIRNSFNDPLSKDTEQRMVEMISKADLVVLDDLGAETGSMHTDSTASDFTSRTLYALVNGRQNKSTIITTNLSSKELDKKYDRKLMSRLYKGTIANNSILTFNNTNDKRSKIEF